MKSPNKSALLLLCLAAFSFQACSAMDLHLDGGKQGWDEDAWYVQLDGVMGGQSSGQLKFDNNDMMVFTGDIVTDGGGFSSVRRRFSPPMDLTPYAGIVLELETTRGSINPLSAPLGLHLNWGDVPTSYGFASAFAVPLSTMPNTPVSVYLPMSSFDRADWRGNVCQRCTMDATQVNEMRFSVLFQDGPFQVHIKSITAVIEEPAISTYASPTIALEDSSNLMTLVENTIAKGSSLYDYGYPELCIAIYRSVLNTLLASEGEAVSDAEKTAICEGLQRAATFENDKTEVAWTLRGTLDGFLAGGGSSGGVMASEWVQQCVPVTSFAS